MVSPRERGRELPTERLTDRLEPDADPATLRGRLAQTLALLIRTGAGGFTSGEASPLGWARRTSDYVHQLRARGVRMATIGERTGDARIGRYRLADPVTLLTGGEGLL